MPSPKRQGVEREQSGKRGEPSFTVIRIDRDELARDPFRYVTDPPRLPKDRRIHCEDDE